MAKRKEDRLVNHWSNRPDTISQECRLAAKRERGPHRSLRKVNKSQFVWVRTEIRRNRLPRNSLKTELPRPTPRAQSLNNRGWVTSFKNWPRTRHQVELAVYIIDSGGASKRKLAEVGITCKLICPTHKASWHCCFVTTRLAIVQLWNVRCIVITASAEHTLNTLIAHTRAFRVENPPSPSRAIFPALPSKPSRVSTAR